MALAAEPVVVPVEGVFERERPQALRGGQRVGWAGTTVAEVTQQLVGLCDGGADAVARSVLDVELGGEQVAGKAPDCVLGFGAAAIHPGEDPVCRRRVGYPEVAE